MWPQQPIKLSDLEKNPMKHVRLLNKHQSILLCPTYPEMLYVSPVMKNLLVGYKYAKLFAADQCLCFHYTDSTISLYPKSEIASLLPSGFL